MTLRQFTLALATATATATIGIGSVTAQDTSSFPSQPVRLILNASPGGGSDIMARTLQPALEEALGQTVIVENRPGGGSAAQLSALTGAEPDGYTIGSVTNSHIGNFHQTLKQYSVDSVDWIAGIVSEPFILTVPANTEVETLEDIVTRINAGEEFVVSGFFRGSGGHVTWEMFAEAAGLPKDGARWVPYDSIGDAVTAALGGHVDAVVAYADLVQDHVAAGTLKVVAVQADARVPQLPDAPTFAEAGYEIDPNWQQFRGIIAPKGVPIEIKEKLAGAFEQAIQSPEFQRYIEEAALVESYMGPAEFADYAQQQDETTSQWLNQLGMSQ